jgi:hypothetical protein
MGALNELISAWRNNPSADSTISICARLGSAGREDWLREVAASAETRHAHDASVMVAVGRMFLDAGLLGDAQTAFVTAGRVDDGDPAPFRFLGEVLLRKGDAVRAQQVLARALALDDADADANRLQEQAASLVPVQKRYGQQRAASEAVKLLPRPASPLTNGRTQPLVESVKRSPSRPPVANGGEPPLPRFDTGNDPIEVSEVYALSAPAPLAIPARANAAGAPRGPVASNTPFGKSRAPVPPARRPPRAPEPSVDDITELVPLATFDDISAVDVSDLVADSGLPSFDDVTTGVGARLAGTPGALPQPAALPHARSNGLHGVPSPSFAAPAPLARPAPPPSPLPAPALPSRAPALPVSAPVPTFRGSPPATQFHDAAEVSPAILLEHLARVGMFEPSGGAAPAWESAPRQKSRGIIPLVAAIVLVAGAGIGGYKYAYKVKAERAERAAALTTEVNTLLHSGKLADLKATDDKLSRVFDLDSRSARAGRLWLENRVLGALLLNDELRGLDSAIYRGREVGLRERELAVGRVASFLVEGDLAGAAAQLPKWDGEAGKDAFYQLAAGAVLERAGDARALERYDAARSLDAKLVPADLLLARLLLLEYGVAKARPVLDELAKKMPADDPNLRALAALSWVVDAERGAEPPESARINPDDTRRLVFPLRAVPAMVEAATAFAKGDLPAAGKAIDSALSVVDGPSLAATLGFLAIDAGNEALARKAALKALSFAALYPRARTLAARVALLGGRLDEAQKAVEELDPKSADVAVVRGVVAYETGDAAELTNALAALDAASSQAFAGLAAGPGVLLASRYPDQKTIDAIALPSVPWGELVACDAALDTGNLALAEKLLSARAESPAPVHLLRVARLRRYQKRLDDALAASQQAMSEKPTVALVIERVTELVEKEQLAPARELVARYPALLGPVAQWLGVVLDVAANQPKQAAARLAQLDPPPDEAPAVLRILAGRALVAANDKRARPYLVGLVRRLGKHPDALAAAALLNAP